MNGNIPLHPKRGLDPHLTFCPRCGGDANDLTIGHLRRVELIDNWGRSYDPKQYAYANRGEGTRRVIQELEKANRRFRDWQDVPEGERVPSNGPCDKCEAELVEHKALVAAGGIYWNCNSCSQSGVIKAQSELAKAVRRHAGIEAPAPVGVQFETCDEHTPRPISLT